MNRIRPLLIGLTMFALAGCLGGQEPADTTDPVETGDTAGDTQETNNVIYRGRLEEAGVSIFMQGTHKLTLDDGRFILLESEDVDLDDYLNDDVEVFGSVRPTVEAGGMIMRVESIKSLSASSSSSSAETGTGSSSSSSEESDESSSSSAAGASSSAEDTMTQTSSASDTAMSADLEAKAALMAKDKQGPENWTQSYCSTHIGFCIPVHRNWWFKSFGTTSSALWHLEIGPSEMNNLGEGPITVRLVSGDIASSGMSDGQVLVQGDLVTGARSWAGNRHFEIRGPANLESAVRYITEQLKEASN